jgi:glutamate racemase
VKSSDPIAVFDSGLGGLTVFRAIRKHLPRENLFYFGDTAHLPYGTKSAETVRRLTLGHLEFLTRRRIKCAVIACNTASAVALQALKRRLHIPVLGVIDPGIREAIVATRNGRIGVLGTATTVASGAYQRGLKNQGRRIRLVAQACPLFVPLIEEGWSRHPVTEAVARHYLAPLIRARVDTVVMGCTHYPLIRAVLQRILGSNVRLVDSAFAVARQTGRSLREMSMLCAKRKRGAARFFLTDTGGSFPLVAARFLGEAPGKLTAVGLGFKVLAKAKLA